MDFFSQEKQKQGEGASSSVAVDAGDDEDHETAGMTIADLSKLLSDDKADPDAAQGADDFEGHFPDTDDDEGY